MQAAAAFHVPVAVAKNIERITEAVRTGGGFPWHEHDPALFEGVERVFRPGYVMNLVSSWIPALDGVEAKLAAGARVADVGCGHGSSTLLLGEAFPASVIVGFDYHRPSVDLARKRAVDAGLADRVSFAVASAADFPGPDYDLVTIFDALHDMSDALGAARHIREVLKEDGTLLLVEPMPVTGSRTTSTRWDGAITRPPRSSAWRTPCRRNPEPPSARRRVRRR